MTLGEARYFLQNIKTTRFFCNHGALPRGCILFSSRQEILSWVTLNKKQDINSALKKASYAAWALDSKEKQIYSAFSAAYDITLTAVTKAMQPMCQSADADTVDCVVGAAADDAALLTMCLTASDTIALKHLAHARRRWRAWEAGYGVECDINGTLLCYRKP